MSHRTGPRTRVPGLDRREHLRDAAARIFAEQGYHASSMQEIADAIGFTKASIYYYYKSKEDLLFDILTYADGQTLAFLDAEKARGDDPLTHVGRIVAAYVRWYLAHPNIARVAFRDWGALSGEALAVQVARRRHYGHVLRASIDRCGREGVISAQADVTLISNFINGAVAAANVWFDPDGQAAPEVIAKAFGDMAVTILVGVPFRPA